MGETVLELQSLAERFSIGKNKGKNVLIPLEVKFRGKKSSKKRRLSPSTPESRTQY